MASFEIRVAQLDDAEGIARARIVTWQDAYRGMVDDDFLDALSVESATEQLRERLISEASQDAPGVYRLVAVGEGQVVGFCTCGVKPDVPFEGDWFMYALYVLPSFQGKGVGRALLLRAQEMGRHRGASRMVFGVFSANEPSKTFYVRTGAKFVETGDFELGGKRYPTDYCFYHLGES